MSRRSTVADRRSRDGKQDEGYTSDPLSLSPVGQGVGAGCADGTRGADETDQTNFGGR